MESRYLENVACFTGLVREFVANPRYISLSLVASDYRKVLTSIEYAAKYQRRNTEAMVNNALRILCYAQLDQDQKKYIVDSSKREIEALQPYYPKHLMSLMRATYALGEQEPGPSPRPRPDL